MNLLNLMSAMILLIFLMYVVNYTYHNVKNGKKEEEIMCMDNAYFKLKDAALCIQCETIFSRENFKQCPGCGSEAIFVVNMALQTDAQLEKSAIAKVKGISIH